MQTDQILPELDKHLRRHSGLEQRTYLGMSSIGYCPRKIYFDLTRGRSFDDRDARMCYVGYLFERDLRERLITVGVLNHYGPLNDPKNPVGKELIAPFDNRFRGHTDGELDGETLLEIKSVSLRRFEEVDYNGVCINEHYAQVQCYMRYGHYAHTVLIYVCRDSFQHMLFDIPYRFADGEVYEGKAKRILAALDRREAPRCTCQRCKE